MTITVTLGSPRMWIAIGLLTLAMAAYPTPAKDALLMPETRRRTWRERLHWRRWHRAQEEAGDREAASFITALSDSRRDSRNIASKTGRHRAAPQSVRVTMPGLRTQPRADLATSGAPWDPAPEPEHLSAPVQAQGPASLSGPGSLTASAAGQPFPKEPRSLDTWAPGDSAEPPTIVGGMLPVIDGTVGEYVRNLPRYDSDDDR